MSNKVMKVHRKVAGKYKREIVNDYMNNVLSMSIWYRMKFAWEIIRGMH